MGRTTVFRQSGLGGGTRRCRGVVGHVVSVLDTDRTSGDIGLCVGSPKISRTPRDVPILIKVILWSYNKQKKCECKDYRFLYTRIYKDTKLKDKIK